MPSRRAGTPIPASPRALQLGLERVLAAVRQEIDGAIDRPHVPPETLHDLHRDLRRLSSGLRLWGERLAPRHAPDLPPMIRRLRRFARLVGRVRDRDVTLALLEPLARGPRRSRPDRPLGRFLAQLHEEGRTGRELLRAFLTTERRGGLLDQVGAALDRPVRAGARHQLTEIFREEWQVHRRRVRRAHRRARKRPTTDRLHRLRIRIRRWRHLASLAEIAQISPPEPLEPRLRSLQDRLGRLHDLDIALDALPAELASSPAARHLAARRELEQQRAHALMERHGSRRPAHRTASRGER